MESLASVVSKSDIPDIYNILKNIELACKLIATNIRHVNILSNNGTNKSNFNKNKKN